MREVKLQSGKTLRITPAPFEDSKNLYQALLEEARSIQFTGGLDTFGVMKDALCIGFGSKKIESCLWKCLERAMYDGAKITKDTFESVEAREDYMDICYEVTVENVGPFWKSLYARFKALIDQVNALQS